MHPLRLMIVDANDLARNGLIRIMTQHENAIDLLGAFATLEIFETTLQQTATPFHILLLDDVLSPVKDFFSVIQYLVREYPNSAIVIMSRKLSARYVQRLIDAGVSGFVYKDDPLEKILINGLQMVRKGQVYISPRIASFTFSTRSHTNLPLNETDREVLWLLAQGYSMQEIASMLQIVVRSVYRIRNKLRTALEVRTNEQIVDEARKRGLLNLPTN